MTKLAAFTLIAVIVSGLLFVLIRSVVVNPPVLGFYYLGVIAPALTVIARSLATVFTSHDGKPGRGCLGTLRCHPLLSRCRPSPNVHGAATKLTSSARGGATLGRWPDRESSL
ncbi:MAG: hypothetical protein ABSC13_02720 [Dehalococcoidia bacterium]|jgi:hypothetical protein